MANSVVTFLFAAGRRAKLNRVPPVLYVLLLFIIALTAVHLFREYQQTKKELATLQKGSTKEGAEENKRIVAEVGKLVVLPQGEEPTVATVSDAKLLKDKPFFSQAQNGDKVLIFSKAQQAVLYRPTVKKIIAAGPIAVQAESPTVSPEPTISNAPSRASRPIAPSPTVPQPTGQ